eukprot:TRINITY_DN81412_c0_g1_i1.p1 TRINITY_DN81412_c0_g1~~TRINITY_DN81412_c0_g1_i1.p1  ORF type:complete len:148 (-),score=16.18 TRINITY_DN81412_c0_g1_i1:76-519(-)
MPPHSSGMLLPLGLATLAVLTLVHTVPTGYITATAPCTAPKFRGSHSARNFKIGDVDVKEIPVEADSPKVMFGTGFAFVLGFLFPFFHGLTLAVFLAATAYFLGSIAPTPAPAGDDIAAYGKLVKGIGDFGVRLYNYVVRMINKYTQ